MTRHGQRLFHDCEVVAMRGAWRDGATYVALAAHYEVHPFTMLRIVQGITYAEVPGAVTANERRDRKRISPRVRQQTNGGAWRP
jgi:hypothetical protein